MLSVNFPFSCFNIIVRYNGVVTTCIFECLPYLTCYSSCQIRFSSLLLKVIRSLLCLPYPWHSSIHFRFPGSFGVSFLLIGMKFTQLMGFFCLLLYLATVIVWFRFRTWIESILSSHYVGYRPIINGYQLHYLQKITWNNTHAHLWNDSKVMKQLIFSSNSRCVTICRKSKKRGKKQFSSWKISVKMVLREV